MKNLKMLGLTVALAAASLATFAGAASADEFTSPFGTTYDKEVIAKSTNMELSGSFVTVKCSQSEFKSKVEEHGWGTDVGGALSSLTFTGCNYTVTVNSKGSMDVDSSGDFDLFGTQFSAATSIGTCVFTANSTFGTKIGVLQDGSNARFNFSGEIPRTSGNFLCGTHGHWIGTYDLTTPNDLWVH